MRFHQHLLLRLSSTARPLKRATRSTFFLLSIFFVFVAVTAFTFSSLPSNTITLPIEVYAPNGFDPTGGSQPAPFGDETVTINIADVSAVDSLAFWMHQPYYHLGGGSTFDEQEGFDNEGAVAISINGGVFVDIRDENTDCAWPESQMGPHDNNPGSSNSSSIADNCIGGPTPSPRFSVPASFSGGLATGDNTITFRFNGTKGIRSGYRVIALAAVGGAVGMQDLTWDRGAYNWMNGGLLADGTTTFQMDNPTTWTAPAGADAANGEVLWTSRNLLTDHVRQANPSMPGDVIVASCADCHAKDGSDLWYFNYSNESIIARSAFHGLTQEQGEDIAAFIRSVQLQDNEGQYYDPPGRPWNPPFQPGPTYGLDGQGVNAWDELTDNESHYWAAGAGLDDYLNSALDEGLYLFAGDGDPGNGIPPTTMNTFSDPSTGRQELTWEQFASGARDDIDHKKYPLAIQFPDWNTWLPDISPVGDIPGGDIRNDEWWGLYEWYAGDANSTSWSGSNVSGLNPNDPSSMFNVFKRFGQMYIHSGNFRRAASGKGASSAIDAKEDLSAAQYNIVKVWEIFQHFDLYDHADQTIDHPFLSDDATYSSWSLDIGMLTRGRHFFDLAPHILGNNRQDADHWHWGSFLGQKWATHIWYQMQVTMDPGTMPDYSDGNPVDWQYQDGHMGEFTGATGLDASYRMFASQIRRFQLSYTPGVGVTPDGWDTNAKIKNRALWAKQGQPSWALWALAPDQGNKWNRVFNSIPTDDKRRLTTAWLRAWWDSYSREPISDFQQRQCTDNNKMCWEPATYVPQPNAWVGVENIKADRFYNGLKYAADGGVAGGVVDSIAEDWASPMWPEANASNYSGNGLPYSWEDIANNRDGTTTIQAIPLAAGWNLISSHVAPDSPDMPSVFGGVSSVEIVRDESGNEYRPENGTNDIGPWSDGESYMVYVTSADTLRLSGTAIAVDSPIALSEGWNFVPYYPGATQSPPDALGSIVNELVMVKDQTGAGYIPSYNIDQIGELKPGQGYKVYVNSGVELIYEEGTRASTTSSTAVSGSTLDE